MPKLCTLVARCPTTLLPMPAAEYPPRLDVLVHLAGLQGTGPKYRSCAYPEGGQGVAEADLEMYEKISASVAWTRTLGVVRKGFQIEVDLENGREEHLARITSYAILYHYENSPY